MIFVFNDTQSLWEQKISGYQPAELVLFSGGTQSACGFADSGVGPHYCSADSTVRIDTDFFRELSTRFGAPGDFAQAYVIAHEMGHHVQNITGISGKVHQEEQNNPEGANELSVRLELQADCLAGVWAHQVFARGDLEQGDIEEALGAAAAVGDDTLQQQADRHDRPGHLDARLRRAALAVVQHRLRERRRRHLRHVQRRHLVSRGGAMRRPGARSTDCRAKREAPPEAERRPAP